MPVQVQENNLQLPEKTVRNKSNSRQHDNIHVMLSKKLNKTYVTLKTFLRKLLTHLKQKMDIPVISTKCNKTTAFATI
jgi:hypothetical protein